MDNSNVYLKQNVLAEPLFNQWYAWPGLIFPATAAMYIANSHIKIMQSFVSAPQIHAAALKNPKNHGGPYLNYDQSRVNEVKQLLDETVRNQEHMLRFAEAVKALDSLLSAEANGSSLEPLYKKVPDALRGYVELVYDLNNNPSIRFIEGLLYRSPYYNSASQSELLSLVEKDDRSFIFSTPLLKSDGHLQLDIDFSDERLDALFAMQRSPQPYSRIKESLGVKDRDDELFSSFFTQDVPRGSDKFSGEGVRVRYMGHACLLIESKDVAILTDPVISCGIDNGVPRYSYNDLPDRIDFVLITHAHQDHCMLETLLRLRHRIESIIVPKNNPGTLTDPSLRLMLQNIGFENVTEIDEMEVIKITGGRIIGLPFLGEHGDLNIRTKSAYYASLEGRSVILAADSNNVEPVMYEHVHEITKDIDVLFIGMECDGAPLTWIYGPLLTKPVARKVDQSRRLNGSDFEKGMAMVERFKPKQVYVYAMGQEPWMTYVTSIQYTEESHPIIESNKLVEGCRERGIISERLFGRKEILC
jgi:L-ascorbate metabolism protein UlaG (beta-lactamase superfamily)